MHQVQIEPLNVDDQLVQVGQISLCLAHDDVKRHAAQRALTRRQAALTRHADGVPTSSVVRRFVVANRTLARKGVPTVSAKMVGIRVDYIASTALAHLYLDIWRVFLHIARRITHCEFRVAVFLTVRSDVSTMDERNVR